MKIKDIALIGLLSATLTAGKLALSFIPNVEIVTFLIIIYTLVFGLKRTLFITFIFVTTETLIYGFGTWTLSYYIIWLVLVIITFCMSKVIKSEYGWAIYSGIYGLMFGLLFAIFESMFYGIGYGIAYWIRGIPFDAIHMVSNFILMVILYQPISNLLKKRKLYLKST